MLSSCILKLSESSKYKSQFPKIVSKIIVDHYFCSILIDKDVKIIPAFFNAQYAYRIGLLQIKVFVSEYYQRLYMSIFTSNLIIYNKEYFSPIMKKQMFRQFVMMNNVTFFISNSNGISDTRDEQRDPREINAKINLLISNHFSSIQEQKKNKHNRLYQWIHSLSSPQIKELFTISHPESVKQILDSLSRIAAIHQSPIYQRQPVKKINKRKQNHNKMKEIFSRIKIACTSRPFVFIDPTYALNWLAKGLGNYYLAPNQNENDWDGRLNCIWHSREEYQCVLESCLIQVFKKQLWAKYNAKDIGNQQQLLKKINQFTSDRFKNQSNPFGVSIAEILKKGNMDECLALGEKFQNEYYANLQELSLRLLEQQEKTIKIEPKKKSKKPKKKHTKLNKTFDQQISFKPLPITVPLPRALGVINNPETPQLFDTQVEKPIDRKSQYQKTSLQAGEQRVRQVQFENHFIQENYMINQFDDIRSSRSTCTNNSQGQRSFNHSDQKIKYVEKNSKTPSICKVVMETVQKNVNRMIFSRIQTISQKNKGLWALKNEAFRKLYDYLRDYHPNFEARIYGSFAAGSSLPHSDLDVLLTPYTQMVIANDFLIELAEHIEVESWVSCCKPILTAKFPVIKLIIDPYANVDGFPSGFKYQSYEEQLKKPYLIKVDLSLNRHGAANTGLIATELLRTVYSQSPLIQDTVILLKSILDSRELNEGYKGGISSFCLFTMLICFIQHKKINLNCTLLDLITGFINFISKEFDPNTMVFRYKSDEKCLISYEQYLSIPGNISLKKSGKLKIIDPTTDKLIQASFSKYDEVIDTLKKILDFIETLEVQMQNVYDSVKIKHKKHFFNAVPLIEKNVQESSIFGLLQDFLFLE